ncbi:MAG: serine/threonine-protein phosphatase [Bacteroidetes bacterium]|nr:serine/threonine-protein phosphatase [Bacteroidota bacterium]
MKRMITKYLIYALSAISTSILIVSLIDLSASIDELATSTIMHNKDEVFHEFDHYFHPIVEAVEIAIERGESGFFDEISREEFDLHFIPLLKNSIPISSILMANSKGDEKMLMKNDSTWINIHTYVEAGEVKAEGYEWKYVHGSLEMIKTWEVDQSIDPRKQLWLTEAFEKHGSLNWTEPYIIYNTFDPGITASREWINSKGEIFYFGFDIMLSDISKFTTSIEFSRHGKVFVLTEDDRVLGLPNDQKFESENSYQSSILKSMENIGIPVLSQTLDIWHQTENGNDCFSFKFDRKKWWGSISEYKMGDNTYRIGIIAPESDFLSSIEHSRKLISGGFVLIFLFTIAFIRTFRQIKKANLLLHNKNIEIANHLSVIEEQKLSVEMKNKEILDSITYAKRIQTAILLPDNRVKEYLEKSFIIYIPKDIVAGDFYWIESISNQNSNSSISILFAAADCTGHGVPGAMVHVICSHALNRSVKEFGLSDPGQILDKTREIVIREFEKSDEVVMDGMDIALCSLNGNMLKYSGAFNPLWIVRDGEIIEIKADRQPVGGYVKSNLFTSHQLDLKKGDVIYIFSDGFTDQFGGEHGKKFKQKALKDLFLSVRGKSMDEQKQLITDSFEKWKENYEQVDDVCIIGVQY